MSSSSAIRPFLPPLRLAICSARRPEPPMAHRGVARHGAMQPKERKVPLDVLTGTALSTSESAAAVATANQKYERSPPVCIVERLESIPMDPYFVPYSTVRLSSRLPTLTRRILRFTQGDVTFEGDRKSVISHQNGNNLGP